MFCVLRNVTRTISVCPYFTLRSIFRNFNDYPRAIAAKNKHSDSKRRRRAVTLSRRPRPARARPLTDFAPRGSRERPAESFGIYSIRLRILSSGAKRPISAAIINLRGQSASQERDGDNKKAARNKVSKSSRGQIHAARGNNTRIINNPGVNGGSASRR